MEEVIFVKLIVTHLVEQDITLLLWNPKVHPSVHKSPLLAPLLSHINPLYIHKCYLFKININIQPSMLVSSKINEL
jgi:hypothetical protein